LQLQHAVKVKSVKVHSAANVFQPHWINRTRKYDENTEPIYNKIAGYISGIEIMKHKSTIPISDPPWLRKKSRVNLSIFECGLKQENLSLMCAVAKEVINNYKNYFHVFTNASKVESGETACAYWIPELIALYSFHLNDNNTIFAEKMMTITMALLWLKDYYVASEDKQNIAIFSDCLSILTASKTEHSKCGPIFMDEILRIIHDGPVSIEFIWEPGHLGTKGNEFVDTLAQDASTESDVDYDYFRTQ